jgi:hypothetical protein
MLSLITVETNALVSHCEELLVLFLFVLVDLIFFIAWYNVHRLSNRFIGGVKKKGAKRGTKDERNTKSPEPATRAD